MKLLPPLKPPTFNLLSLGERGVGKTVFLVGSYAELNSTANTSTVSDAPDVPLKSLWFESQYPPEKELLDSILNYIAQTGHYPPPTLKITDFHFAFKQRQRFGVKTLSYFRWWDIPGEYCNFENPYYQTMVLNSHSCCVFINADRLLRDPNYGQNIETLTKQIISLARLVDRGVLAYRFALIFTQCDRLVSGTMVPLQIEEKIQGLIRELDSVDAQYQRFYSGIPIVEQEGQFLLQSNGVSSAFLWLVAELYKKYSFQGSSTLEGSLKGNPDPTAQSIPLITPRTALTLGGILLGLTAIGTVSYFVGDRSVSKVSQRSGDNSQPTQTYQGLTAKQPQNIEALVELANMHLEKGQVEQAIPLVQKIIALDPSNLDWQFNLAKLYELTGKTDQAETIYDQLLAKNPRQFQALVGKALLRQAKGDNATAYDLLNAAEIVAPNPELKEKVQMLAKRVNPNS